MFGALAGLAAFAVACAEPTPVAKADAVAADASSSETASADVPEIAAADTVEEIAVAETASSGWVPTSVTELYGAWENQDEDNIRRYEFRFIDNMFADLLNITPAYRLYRGKIGQPLEIIERGEFKLGNAPSLLTTPQWALDIASVGKQKKSLLVPVEPKYTFGLEVVPGVTREFARVETFARFP
ncbi:MAG: hypothetical protein EXR77_11375 [Myxococcales bacterium]|nr:hypothetical protein [Myxococcales bacterium]